MVRANGANANTEIRALFLTPPAGPKIEVQCTLSGHGRRDWLPLAARPAQGTRDGRRAGRRGPRYAPVAPIPHTAPNPDRARAPLPARQRPASSRTTRKNFW
jgi:hypothetical protein